MRHELCELVGVGPFVRASISAKRDTAARVLFRVDVEALRVSNVLAHGIESNARYGVNAYGVTGNLLFTAVGRALAPYGLVGIGVQAAQSRAPDTYPAGLLGVRVGAGLRGNTGRLRLAFEVAAQGAVLSSYGSVGSYRVGAYWPITIGVAF